MFKKILVSAAFVAAISCAGSAFAALAPLSPSSNYTITVSKLNSNGTVSDVQNVQATTNSSGKLDFTLTSIPTKDEVNFIVLTLKDANGTVVRRGVLPAPPLNDTNKVGINDLASAQADALLATAAAAGTDDPILLAYELVILRSPNITPADISKIVTLGQAAIIGGGVSTFEGYLASKGLTASDIGNLKKCLVYNADPTKKTLREFSAGFFRAVNGVDANGNQVVPAEELQRTGGIMADVFIDAAACANIDLTLISMAHEAAGDGATNSGALSALGTNLVTSIDQSMSAFNHKMSMVKIASDYTNALKSLGAQDSQVTRFLTAVQNMADANANIDKLYSGFYNDPAGYAAAHSTTVDQVMTAMNALYQTAWSSFQTDIASTNAEISALKTAITAANPGLMLPPDFGGYTDPSGNRVNWPLPQTVMVAWLNTLQSFSYTPRDTTTIPAMEAMWMGTCSNAMYWDQQNCTGHGGTWTPGRHSFSTPSATFNSYLALQEDMSIVEMERSSIWDNGNQPSNTQRQAAQETYLSKIQSIRSHINGSAAGGTVLTADQKSAIVRLMMQPNL